MTRLQRTVLIILHVVVIGAMAWWIMRHQSDKATVPVPAAAPTPVDPPKAEAVSPVPAPLALPKVPDEQIEIHGTFRGKPFWARLLKADPAFDGHRKLELVYTPPPPAQIDQTMLIDCPYILVDEHLRVIAWNGRGSWSDAVRKGDAYKVTRELASSAENEESQARTRTIAGDLGWDLHIAPILLALCWRADQGGEVPIVDLFGAQAAKVLKIAWNGEQVELAGETLSALSGKSGFLAGLTDRDGNQVLTVER